MWHQARWPRAAHGRVFSIPWILPLACCLSPFFIVVKEHLRLDDLQREEVYLAQGSAGCTRSAAPAAAFAEGFRELAVKLEGEAGQACHMAREGAKQRAGGAKLLNNQLSCELFLSGRAPAIHEGSAP